MSSVVNHISIVLYSDKHHEDFKRLNLEWLEKYNLTESHDLEILNDPQGTVIDKGGYIFLAMNGSKVIGTAGIAKENNEVYELVKMTVDPLYRGQGISKILLGHCLEKAKELGARKIFLFSNSQLQTAIKLYAKHGFRHVDATGSPLLTADVKMELAL